MKLVVSLFAACAVVSGCSPRAVCVPPALDHVQVGQTVYVYSLGENATVIGRDGEHLLLRRDYGTGISPLYLDREASEVGVPQVERSK